MKITPRVGSPLAGYSNRRSFSTGVHDELFARVMVLDSGGSRAVMVSCDLIGVLPEMTNTIRSASRRLGIPEANTMVCAFHTHSGPTPHLGYGGMDGYMRGISSTVSSAIPRAASDLRESTFAYAVRDIQGLTINRRRPQGGPVDPELVALAW